MKIVSRKNTLENAMYRLSRSMWASYGQHTAAVAAAAHTSSAEYYAPKILLSAFRSIWPWA